MILHVAPLTGVPMIIHMVMVEYLHVVSPEDVGPIAKGLMRISRERPGHVAVPYTPLTSVAYIAKVFLLLQHILHVSRGRFSLGDPGSGRLHFP